MKTKVLVGSLVIGVLITGFPAYNAGFTPVSIGEWFVNSLFATAILGFLGMKFLVNEPRRSRSPSPPPSKKIKKKK
jgi:hypothetical protein